MKKINFVWLMFFGLNLNGQSHIFLIDDFSATQIDNVVNQVMLDSSIVGLSIGILYDRQIVYTNSYGWAEESVTSFAANTKVRWASVSKTITGLMAIKMWEDGNLNFDADIQTYVPGYDSSGITIRDLLHHQSGIEHYGGTCGGGYSGAFNASSTLGDINDCSICFSPPGSAQMYTTFGTNLIGVVLDAIGVSQYGKTYYELFQDWIKTPLNLTSLDQDSTGTDPLMAIGYSGPGLVNAPQSVGWKLPAGGFYSNIIDLSNYCEAILNYAFINADSYDTLWNIQNLALSPTTGCDSLANASIFNNPSFGMQFRISSNLTNADIDFIARHSGSNEIVSTLMWMRPNRGWGLVILSNTTGKSNSLGLIKDNLIPIVECPEYREFSTPRQFNKRILFEADSLININGQFTFNDSLFLDSQLIKMNQTFLTDPPGINSLIKTFNEGCGGFIVPGNN